jgi:hypothetical protein
MDEGNLEPGRAIEIRESRSFNRPIELRFIIILTHSSRRSPLPPNSDSMGFIQLSSLRSGL